MSYSLYLCHISDKLLSPNLTEGADVSSPQMFPPSHNIYYSRTTVFVEMFKGRNSETFKCKNVQEKSYEYSNIDIFKCANVKMYKCSNLEIFNQGINVEMLKI